MNKAEIIKCVTVGDGAVGKTCILLAYANNTYNEEYTPTIFDNFSANVMVDGRPVMISLWDTAGQEEYDRLRPLSYPGTNVFLMCYSVVSRDSFTNISQKWTKEIKHHAPQAHVILVGTKCDLRTDEKTVQKLKMLGKSFVSEQEGQDLAKKMGASKYMECSAKTGENIKQVFDHVVRTGLYSQPAKKKNITVCNIM